MAEALLTKDPENLKEVISVGYSKLFDRQWPMWVGGLLFGFINVFMFAFEKAWSVADGVRNWGNWFFNSVEITEITIINPHLYSTSYFKFWYNCRRFSFSTSCKAIPNPKCSR
jgi:hypothetical protein